MNLLDFKSQTQYIQQTLFLLKISPFKIQQQNQEANRISKSQGLPLRAGKSHLKSMVAAGLGKAESRRNPLFRIFISSVLLPQLTHHTSPLKGSSQQPVYK